MPSKKQSIPYACTSCHQLFESSDTPVTYRSKLYHPACLEAKKAAVRAKDAVKSAKLNDPALKALIVYVKELFSLPTSTALVDKQIKDMHSSERPISYEDMLLALRYFYDIQGNKINSEYAPNVGIIPYVVDEAREFRAAIRNAEEANKDFAPINKVVTVKVKPDNRPSMKYRMEDL